MPYKDYLIIFEHNSKRVHTKECKEKHKTNASKRKRVKGRFTNAL